MSDDVVEPMETLTVAGRSYISVDDLAASLRRRGATFRQRALAYGDPIPAEDFTDAVAKHALAEAYEQLADGLQFAVLAHLAEQPGDSLVCTVDGHPGIDAPAE